jgi:hypothetical protein
MKTVISFFLLLSLFSSASAEEIDALSLLKRDLAEMIEVHSNKEIWYCPDNTCEMYKAIESHPDFPAFIYLHLFHESGYIYLKESIGDFKAFRNVAVEEPNIRAKVASYCPTEKKSPSCILEHMKQKLGITLCFGRYDEGYFCYGCKENENICKKLQQGNQGDGK